MRMMEVVNNYTATVYFRGSVDETTGSIMKMSTITHNDISNIDEDKG